MLHVLYSMGLNELVRTILFSKVTITFRRFDKIRTVVNGMAPKAFSPHDE
jgi:hypothetical protein